jgi:hypothetical protein
VRSITQQLDACAAAPFASANLSWNVEIHLTPGGIVWEKTRGKDWHEAVETALAKSYIVAAQVNGIVAYPVATAA